MPNFSPEKLIAANYEEGIILFLASGDKTLIGKDIQEAFKNWQAMPEEEKIALNICMEKGLDKHGLSLFQALIRGFDIWNKTQDQFGAPGWYVADSSVHHLSKQMGEKLTSLFHSMDMIWFAYNENNCSDPFTEGEKNCSVNNADLKNTESAVSVKSDREKTALQSSKADMERGATKRRVEIVDLLDESNLFNSETEKVGLKLSPTGDNDTENKQKISSLSTIHSNDQKLLEEKYFLRNLLDDDLVVHLDFEKQINPILGNMEAQI